MPLGDPRTPAEMAGDPPVSAPTPPSSLVEIMAPGEDLPEPPAAARQAAVPGQESPSRRSAGLARAPWPFSAARSLLVASAKVVLVVSLAWGLLFNFSEVRGSSM